MHLASYTYKPTSKNAVNCQLDRRRRSCSAS